MSVVRKETCNSAESPRRGVLAKEATVRLARLPDPELLMDNGGNKGLAMHSFLTAVTI